MDSQVQTLTHITNMAYRVYLTSVCIDLCLSFPSKHSLKLQNSPPAIPHRFYSQKLYIIIVLSLFKVEGCVIQVERALGLNDQIF